MAKLKWTKADDGGKAAHVGPFTLYVYRIPRRSSWAADIGGERLGVFPTVPTAKRGAVERARKLFSRCLRELS